MTSALFIIVSNQKLLVLNFLEQVQVNIGLHARWSNRTDQADLVRPQNVNENNIPDDKRQRLRFGSAHHVLE